MKSEAPRVSGSSTNVPPGGTKEHLEPGESRHQRGFQKYDGRGYYEEKECGGLRGPMSSEKTEFEVWGGQIQHGGDQWSVYGPEGDTIPDERLGGEIGGMAEGRNARVGQTAAHDITTLSLEEWLDSTSSEYLDTEYLEGSPPRGLLDMDTEAYIAGELEEPFTNMSPSIASGGDWAGDDMDESNRAQDFHESSDITGTGGVGGFGMRGRYVGGRDYAYSRGVTEDDSGSYSILGPANASPGAFESQFWRPNLRG